MFCKFNHVIICIVLTSIVFSCFFVCFVSANSTNDIDNHTTYEITPWMKKYNLTSKSQINADYFGGDGWQRIMCMDISPLDDNKVVFGTDTSGIWTTFDGGVSWRNTSSGFNCLGVLDVKFDPVNSNIVYAVGYPGYNWDYSNGFGVYISKDGGVTWSEILSNIKFKQQQCKMSVIAFKSFNQDHSQVYIATYENGIMTSSDYGDNWSKKEFSDYNILGIDAIDDVMVVLTKQDGIFIQKNSSDQFKKLVLPYEDICESDISSVRINPFDSSNAIFVTPKYLCNIYDFGESFDCIENKEVAYRPYISVSFGLKEKSGIQPIYISRNLSPIGKSYDNGKTVEYAQIDKTLSFNPCEAWYQSVFAVSHINPDIIYATTFTEISKSVDGCKNFYITSSGFSGMRITDYAFDENDNNNYWFSFIDAGLTKTDISENYEEYPAMYYAGSDYNKIRYKGNKTVQAIAMDPKNSDRIIFSIGTGGENTILKETTDGGITYREIEGTNGTCCKIAFHSQKPNTIYAGNYISRDNGETFQNCNYEIRAVSKVNSDIVWGVKDGIIYHSIDGGKSFTSTKVGTGGVNIKLIPDNVDEQKLYICDYVTGYTILTNEGTSRVNCGFVCWTMAQDPKNSKHFVAGGCDSSNKRPANGIYESYDSGNSWRLVTGLTGSQDVWSLAFHPNLPRVFIGTSSGTFVYEYEKFNNNTFYFSLSDSITKLYNTKNYACFGIIIKVYYEKLDNKIKNIELENIKAMPYEIKKIKIPQNCKFFIIDSKLNIKSISNTIFNIE